MVRGLSPFPPRGDTATARRPRRRVLVAGGVCAVVLGSVAGTVAASGHASSGRPAATKAAVPTYGGRPCPDPVGHAITLCRLGVHGTPDLSRRRFAQLRRQEVTIGQPVTALTPNPDRDGSAAWPLVDSLAQRMGELRYDAATGRFKLAALDGAVYSVTSLKTRGHGCAASASQSKQFPLLQIIAPKAPSHGTQAFVDGRALDPASVAFRAFAAQRGGGTGCGPARPERGRVRALIDPAVGATAHARLSDGTINTVTEYDAKAPFGGTVYVMSNTTSVSVGGIARGMVRVGTPVAKADQFRRCDPNSDGTLTWNYWSIHTRNAARPRIYGWIPARCHR
ncbi:MAG: hypothetical protein REI11_15340 [Patulibacter sp.]|nr:hypothetical protein [Patulibacter sp.]